MKTTAAAGAASTMKTFSATKTAAAAGMPAHDFVAARPSLRVKARGSATIHASKSAAVMAEGAFSPAAGVEPRAVRPETWPIGPMSPSFGPLHVAALSGQARVP